MKKITILIILCFTTFCISQNEKTKRAITKLSYISIEEYKKKHLGPLTKKDSLNLFTIGDKELIRVNEKHFGYKEGTYVEYTYKDSTFLDIYKKIAFNHKKDSLSKLTRMKLWKDDIKVFFSKNVPKKTKKQFYSFASSVVNEIDSLKINEVKKVEDSNFIVYYSNGFEYESRMSDYKNSQTYSYWKSGYNIYKSAMRINTEQLFNEALRLNKMKSLFIQSLGYFDFNNDIDCENYFSGCYQEKVDLTDIDLEIIKYHYDYGICKGTKLETFEEQHKKAKNMYLMYNHKIRFLHLNE